MKNLTTIQLYGNTKGVLTTADNTAFPVTFSISDIRDISKRNGTFSKSITVNGTKENNRLLNYYYDVNIKAGTFNINRIQECDVIQNGITIMTNMIIQLISVNKLQLDNNHEEQITYTLLLKDRMGDLFSQIGNKLLTDLNITSGITTTLTAFNIFNSFGNTYLKTFKFLQPHISKNWNGTPYLDIAEVQPGIFAKSYMDKIFANAGYSYQWDKQFDEFVGFDKLIIPYNGDKPKTTSVEADAFLVSVKTTGTTIIPNTTKTVNSKPSITNSLITFISYPIEIQDLQNRWDGADWVTPNIPSNHEAMFELEYDYQLYVELPTPSTLSMWNKNVLGGGVLQGVENATLKFMATPTVVIKQETKILASEPLGQFEVRTLGTPYAAGITMISSGTTSVSITSEILPFNLIDFHVQLNLNNSADRTNVTTNFYVDPFNISNPTPNSGIKFKITGARLIIRTLEEVDYGYNIPIILQNFIPKKVKQSDFVKSIFTMYNLYAELDRNNPKRLILKSRDDFYDSGQIVDWTYKLDKSRPQDMKFLPELQSKSLVLTYKHDDKDNTGDVYLTAVGEEFGQQKYIFDNEYTRGEDRKELIFSPTLCFNDKDTLQVLPLVNGYSPSNNLRILYDGGILPCNPYFIANYTSGTSQADIVGYTSTTATTYSYVGHWNRPVSPTFDINFGVCDYYPRTDRFGSVTNNNLYNLFWRRTLNQINTGKMLIAYFKLDEVDIQKLRLNHKIRIDNSWWNINKVIDYDANSNNTTKVELLSIDDSLKLAPYLTRPVQELNNTSLLIRRPRQSWNNGLIIWNNQNHTNFPFPIIGTNNWIINPVRHTTIWGDNNYITNDSLIFGSYNTNFGKKSIIFGDGNTITGDNASNIFIFGNNINATSGNTIYTDNIIMSSGSTINGVDTTGVLLSHGNTGVLTFSGISAASSTQISISPVTGFVVDNETNANVPAYIYVTYSGTSAITVNTISSSTVSYVLLDNAGVPFFQTTFPTSAQRKANIWLGKMSHPNLTTLGVVVNEPDFITSPLQQYRDLFQATPYINNGVYPSANGANLNVNTTTGSILGDGINFHLNNRDPNTIVEPPHTPLSFVYRTQTGGTTGFVIAINPASYDVGGIVTPIGGGANTSTLQYIFIIPAVGYTIIYGQTTYASLADAIAAVGTENPTIFPNLINNSLLIGVLAVNKNATQLNDPAQAKFFRADIFGQIIGAVGGTSTGTLQTAYNNSGIPQITTTSLNGAVTFRGWDGSTNRLLNLQNSGGTTTAFFTEGGGMSATSVSATTYFGLPNSAVSGVTYSGGAGSGTTNFLPKFVSGTTIANSKFTDDGTTGAYSNVSNGTSVSFFNSGNWLTLTRNQTTMVWALGNPQILQENTMYSDGNYGLGIASGGFIAFRASGNTSEKMRINQYGNVSIGTTGSSGTTRFEVSGNTQFFGGVSGRTLNLSGLTLASAGTIHLGINTSNEVVTLPPDESTEFICRNTSGVSIPAGAPVYISGGFGNRPTVAMASSNSGITNAFCIGLMKATTANNADGICIMAGVADGLNTNAWVAGTSLYLSLTAGVLTDIVPPWPEIVVQVATVARQHATQGSLLVRPLLTFKLDKLVDLNISAATNGQVLAYNAVQSAWTNSSTARLTGLTANTISATTYVNLPFWSAGTGTDSIVHKVATNKPTAAALRSLAGGWNTSIGAGSDMSFSWGDTNSITNAPSCALFGQGNDTQSQSSFIAGNSNSIGTAAGGMILGSNCGVQSSDAVALGRSNNIETGATSSIAVGDNNRVKADSQYCFIAGRNSQITGGGDTIIVLGQNLVGTIANSTYVEKLSVGTLGTGTSVTSIGRDANGFIVSASTSGSSPWSAGSGTNSAVLLNSSLSATGISSVAIGTANTASGAYSFVQGRQNIATGTSASAFGRLTQALGAQSMAIGSSTIALGNNSFAQGDGSLAQGVGSVCMGTDGTAVGSYSMSVNFTNDTNGTVSFACGQENTANGYASFASGEDNFANGGRSHVEGQGNMAGGDWSHAEGLNTIASGASSHAEGELTRSMGSYTHAEGWMCTATTSGAHAEGEETFAADAGAHAEGGGTKALGEYSHAEGLRTTAFTVYTHSEGIETLAYGLYAHSEGQFTIASGQSSHAQGIVTRALGQASHAEGQGSIALGVASHCEGSNSDANGSNSHAEGNATTATGNESHAEGLSTTAIGSQSHAEGSSSTSGGIASHAEGYNCYAGGDASHAEGSGATSNGIAAHAEGFNTAGYGPMSHAEGHLSQSIGLASHAEGREAYAGGDYSHSEGLSTTADGIGSHAEGTGTTANGTGSHAEGQDGTASGEASHSEGAGCVAFGDYSHAEGFATTASLRAHAEGNQTNADGDNSHAEGSNTFASGNSAHAGGIGAFTRYTGEWARSSYGENSGGFGQYGILDYAATTTGDTLQEIFIGNSNGNRLYIESGSTYRYELTLIARAANGEAKERKGPGLISHSGGTTFFIGNPNLSMSTQFQSAGFTTVAITQTADDTLDALKLEVTGLSGRTLQWYVKLDYIKIS